MKRYISIFMIVPLMLLFAVPALAAPALPRFISGHAITVPYQAATSQGQSFLNSCNDSSSIPYLVAVSGVLELGISASENLIEDSGKYQYLHFIKPYSRSQPIQFYTPSSGQSHGLIGVWAGSTVSLNVLTFQYDPLTNTFDGGTYRQVARGVIFDYIIDSSVLSESTTVYPNYKKVGGLTMEPPTKHPGYNYFLQVKTADIPAHTITVTYKYDDGRTAAGTVTQSYQPGYAYSINSPVIAGYYPSKSEIKGTMGQSDLSFEVTYKKNDAYQSTSKKLTIRYVFEDGTQAWTSNISNRTPGYLYRVLSPRIPGYAADKLTVEGYMPGIDYTETVTYKRIESGQPDPPPYYYLTINYLRRNGQPITREATLMLYVGASYYVRSPIFSYFRPDQLVVSGTMPERNVTVNVYYDETDSPNTGEGDKDDGAGGNPDGEGGGGSSSGGSGGSSGDSSGDGSGSSSGSSSSGGSGGSDGGSSGDSGSGGGSDGDSSSSSGSGGSGDSGGGSGPDGGGSSSSGDSSGSGNKPDVNDDCHCGNGTCGGNGCACGEGCQLCPGGGYWRPGAGDLDNLFPDASEPDTNYPPLHLFDPDDYQYTPPASSEYDPLEGVTVPSQMPRYPDKVSIPDYSGSDPLAPPTISGGNTDPLAPPSISGGGSSDPLAPPNIPGNSDPLAPPNISGNGDPLAPPNISGGSDPLAPPNISDGTDLLAPPNISAGGDPLAPPVISGGTDIFAPPRIEPTGKDPLDPSPIGAS